MTADRRAALVEKVAQMFCSQVDLECSECKTEGGCWYTDIATAAIDLIRAEVRSEALEEAAVVFDRYENDPFTAAVVADHLRRMKGAP